MDTESLPSGTYVVAVSGGVDSVVLLDVLARRGDDRLLVAHFDHGMRDDSADDAAFVQRLAAAYGLEYVGERGALGAKASEATARQARYKFLHQARERSGADGIATAHHADDVVETILINLARGSGWRGLSSLRPQSGGLFRPLLGRSKRELIEYARAHDLQWREDSSNQDERYLRNRFRKRLQTVAPELKQEALRLWREQCDLRDAVEAETARLLPSDGVFSRYDLIMMPRVAGETLLGASAQKISGQSLLSAQCAQALRFAKSARAGSILHVGNALTLKATARQLIVRPLKK